MRPVMVAMVVTPRTMPPAMAPLFNLLPEAVNEGKVLKVVVGLVVKVSGGLEVLVGLIVKVAGVLISSPGKISGVSKERRFVRRES